MPTPPPQGGAGQSWFVLDFEADWEGTPEPQGGLGQSWFVLDFEAAYGEGTTPPQEQLPRSGGTSEAGFYGPIGQRVRFRAPLSASLARNVQYRSDLESRAVKQFAARVPLEGDAAKHVELRVNMVRDSATLYAQSLREDDELIAVLLAVQ